MESVTYTEDDKYVFVFIIFAYTHLFLFATVTLRLRPYAACFRWRFDQNWAPSTYNLSRSAFALWPKNVAMRHGANDVRLNTQIFTFGM